MPINRRPLNANIFKVALVTFLLMIGSTLVLQREAVIAQLNDWKFLPLQENLTELYFNDYDTLPRTITTAQNHTVAFTIRNIENQKTQYNYSIIQQEEDSEVTEKLVSGDIELSHGESKSFNLDVRPRSTSNRSQITVQIVYNAAVRGTAQTSEQQQTIHYWIPGKAE